MNIKVIKAGYSTPLVEVFLLARPLALLVSASVEAEIEDWEIGEDL